MRFRVSKVKSDSLVGVEMVCAVFPGTLQSYLYRYLFSYFVPVCYEDHGYESGDCELMLFSNFEYGKHVLQVVMGGTQRSSTATIFQGDDIHYV